MKSLAMVLVALGTLAGVARAEIRIIDVPPPPRHTRLFGWRIGGLVQTVDDVRLSAFALGLGVEHRLKSRLRIAAEYDYLWLSEDTPDEPSYDGSAHRAAVALRYTLLESRRPLHRTFQLYADAELGGGMVLGTHPMTGTIAEPQAFAGLRLGYSLIRLREDTRASPVLQPELVLRAIGTGYDDPLGFYFGLGLGWGD